MNHPYTYTILRYVHDTTSGESVNIGVALHAPSINFVGAICRGTYGRVAKLFPGLDGDSFKGMTRHIQSYFDAEKESLANALFNPATSILEFAHSVLPVDDSSLQWSAMGSGLTSDPSMTLEQLYERMVSRYDERTKTEVRTDDDVWRKFKQSLSVGKVISHLEPKTIIGQHDEVEFKYAWKNGIWHCFEPISLDLSSRDSIREKAYRCAGQLLSISNSADPFKVYFLLGEPHKRGDSTDDEMSDAFSTALSILDKAPVPKEIVRESEAENFSKNIAALLAHHEQ